MSSILRFSRPFWMMSRRAGQPWVNHIRGRVLNKMWDRSALRSLSSIHISGPISAVSARTVVDIDAVDAELQRWPTPETREAINETIQLMFEDMHYIDQAKKHSIDKGIVAAVSISFVIFLFLNLHSSMV